MLYNTTEHFLYFLNNIIYNYSFYVSKINMYEESKELNEVTEMIESIKSIRYSLNSIALSLNGILWLKLQKAKQNTNIIISTKVMNEIERMKDDAADLLS